MKRVLSEKDKEGQSGPQSGGSPSKTTQDGGSQHFFKIVTVFSCGEFLRCTFLFQTNPLLWPEQTQRRVDKSILFYYPSIYLLSLLVLSLLMFYRSLLKIYLVWYAYRLIQQEGIVPLQQPILLLFLGLIDAATTAWVPLCDGRAHLKLNVISSSSLLFSVRSASDTGQRPSAPRTNSEGHGSLKTKEHSPNPDRDKAAGKKSSDSGEEADKDFILI